MTVTLPYVFATQPAGNVPASYLDANFQAVATGIDVTTAGLVGDGATDNTAVLNTLLALGTASVLFFPPGDYRFNGTINITLGAVWLRGAGNGASLLTFYNGALDSIKIGFQASEIGNIYITDFYINHSGKTGGIAINCDVVANVYFQNLTIDHAWNGIYAQRFNNVLSDKCTILPTAGGTGTYGVKLGAPTANSAGRSDGFITYNMTINPGYAGATGFIWDGPVYTVRHYSLGIIQAYDGIQITNSFNSVDYVPAGGFFFDLEIDGATRNAMRIESGSEFHLVAPSLGNNSGQSGQGNADLDCFLVLPDASYAITRGIYITGGSIGQSVSRRSAARISANNVQICGTSFHGASLAGVASYPVIALGGDGAAQTYDVSLSGCFAGVIFGEGFNPSYGVTLALGVSRVLISGCNFNACVTGGISDSSGDASNRWVGCVNYNGLPLADVASKLAAAPTVSVTGMIYYDTGTNKHYGYNGSWNAFY